MTKRYYVGIAEPGPGSWSLSFPAFPGVVTVGSDLPTVMSHAPGALATAIGELAHDGAVIPSGTLPEPASASFDATDYANAQLVLVPVEVDPSKAALGLAAGYAAMAADESREAEAEAWSEGLILDVAVEPGRGP